MAEAPPARLVSLDAFRGATVAAMVLVNNPGDWTHVYWPLEHAPWHGLTPTDLVFPFFLFIVGVALTLSRRATVAQALVRTGRLIGLGLLLAAFPSFDPSHLRWPGVLQRIALCYLGAFLLQRRLKPRGLVGVTAALLVGYWLLMTRVPLPDGSPASLEPGKSLAAWLDRQLFEGHMWRQSKTWDPEGLLSTLPALATTLIGVLAGAALKSARPPAAKLRGFVLAGLALTAVGLLWSLVFPLNKSLWTSSYVLVSGGLALLALALCHGLLDLGGRSAWAGPAVTYGVNAIFVFVASGLLAKLLARLHVGGPDGPSLQAWLHAVLFASWAPPYAASLLYALANVLFWYAVLRAMQQRGLFVKV